MSKLSMPPQKLCLISVKCCGPSWVCPHRSHVVSLPLLNCHDDQVWLLNAPRNKTCERPQRLSRYHCDWWWRIKPVSRQWCSSLQSKSIPLTLGNIQELHWWTVQNRTVLWACLWEMWRENYREVIIAPGHQPKTCMSPLSSPHTLTEVCVCAERFLRHLRYGHRSKWRAVIQFGQSTDIRAK